MNTINDRYANARLMELEEIYTAVRINNVYFTQTDAIKIVGSRFLLEKLVVSGKIKVPIKEDDKRFTRCKYRAEDILKYANYKHKTQS